MASNVFICILCWFETKSDPTMSKGSKFMRSRTRSTFFTSLFIISLVMFVMGLFAGTSVYSHIELEKAQEEIELMVTLPERTQPQNVDSLERFLNRQPWVKGLNFTSKEEAGAFFVEEVGEDFMALMDGVNPLPSSFDITLHFDWINSDSLDMITQVLQEQEIQKIQDIVFPIGEIEQLRENTNRRVKIAIGIGLIVALIGFFIVNGTIRLAIYAKRLVIRSMQLIGASNGFIRRPFLWMGIYQGVLGALVACGLLIGIIFLLSRMEGIDFARPEAIKELMYRYEFMILLGGIVIFGAVLGWFSSIWAVNRFLNKNLDQLI